MNQNSCILAFPGQGSQYVSMSNNFKSCPEAVLLFAHADKILETSLSEIMQSGPVDALTLTKNAQPAIVLHSYLYWLKVKPLLAKMGFTIDAVLGHSVGEFSALLVANTLNLEQALTLTQYRGLMMQEAVPLGVGSMFAILRVPSDIVNIACREVSNDQWVVVPANYNTPEQIVISGHKEACLLAIEWLEKNFNGRLRTVELNVSAPFHSPLMKPAEEKFAEKITKIPIQPNQIAYYANINAKKYDVGTTSEKIKSNLVSQISGSVLWDQSVQKFPPNHKIIEIGPGKILQGMLKKSLPMAKIFSLDQGLHLDEELKLLEQWLQVD